MMTRREMLAATVSAPALLSVAPTGDPMSADTLRKADTAMNAAPDSRPLKHMGGAPTAFSLRSRADRAGFDMVEHCHRLGLGSAQTRLPSNDPAAVKAFRQRVEAYEMRVVLNTPLPREPGDVAVYDAAVAACKEAGAVALHAAMTQRRYEEFQTFETFKAHFDRCQRSIELAEPVLRKHRIRLAIENHKGWRAAEQADWITRVGSEWVGVCFDFGNNLALCEDPMETLRLLAPSTFYCHMKDMGLDRYEDGFLLSEVVFGDGMVDLAQIVKTLQARDPQMIFALEMITRDPLRIPVFTDGYWATFNDPSSGLPGRDLAKVLTLVRDHPPKRPLPRTTGLDAAAQVKLEDELNQRSVDYCRQHLPLS